MDIQKNNNVRSPAGADPLDSLSIKLDTPVTETPKPAPVSPTVNMQEILKELDKLANRDPDKSDQTEDADEGRQTSQPREEHTEKPSQAKEEKEEKKSPLEIKKRVDLEMDRECAFLSHIPGQAAAGRHDAFTKKDLRDWLAFPERQAEKLFGDRERVLANQKEWLKKHGGTLPDMAEQHKDVETQINKLAVEKEKFLKKNFGAPLVTGGRVAGTWPERLNVLSGMGVNLAMFGAVHEISKLALTPQGQGVLCGVVAGLGYGLGSLIYNLGDNGFDNSVGMAYRLAKSPNSTSWGEKLARTAELYAMVEKAQGRMIFLTDSLSLGSSATLKGLWNKTGGRLISALTFGRVSGKIDLISDSMSMDFVKSRLIAAGKRAAENYKMGELTGEAQSLKDFEFDQQLNDIEKSLEGLKGRSALLRVINSGVTALLVTGTTITAAVATFGGTSIGAFFRGFMG